MYAYGSIFIYIRVQRFFEKDFKFSNPQIIDVRFFINFFFDWSFQLEKKTNLKKIRHIFPNGLNSEDHVTLGKLTIFAENDTP